MDYAEETATCNTNSEDENTADKEHSDAVQNEETIYEEVHAGPRPLSTRSHKAGEMHHQKEIQEFSVNWMAFSTTREREVLCGR